MAATLDKMMERLPKSRRVRVEARAAELIAEEMTLREIRNALHLTQERVAELLGIGQDGVSRLEKRNDLLLSTLQGFVSAMGGELTLRAEFPHRPPITLAGMSALGFDEHARAKKNGAEAALGPSARDGVTARPS